MERKSLLELVGSIFVALIFLSSYLAFSNNNSGTQGGGGNVKTTTVGQTFYSTGTAVANVSSYGQVLIINSSCANASAIMTHLSDLMISYESNGSVGNFYSTSGDQMIVQIGNESAYALYRSLSSAIGANASACTTFGSQASVQLPARVSLYVPDAKSSVTVTVPNSIRNYAVRLAFSANLTVKVNVTVTALLFQNGTVYNMTVTRS